MKSSESKPKHSSRRGIGLVAAAALMIPSAANAEMNTESLKANAAKQALAAAKHLTSLEVVARDVSASEKPVTITPEIVRAVEVHAQPQEVEDDVTSLVTTINAMNGYSREDIEVSAIGNDYGGYNKTVSKDMLDTYGVPVRMSFTTVFNGKPAVDNTISADSIQGIGFHVTSLNPHQQNNIDGYTSIMIVRDGDENWVFTASQQNNVRVSQSTENHTLSGFDDRILKTDAEFIIEAMVDDLAAFDAGELYVPAAATEPVSVEPAVTATLPGTT